jgi:hypothetical protein
LNKLVWQGAAKGGHIHILEWLKNRSDLGGPDQKIDIDVLKCLRIVLYEGHVHILEWFLNNIFITKKYL